MEKYGFLYANQCATQLKVHFPVVLPVNCFYVLKKLWRLLQKSLHQRVHNHGDDEYQHKVVDAHEVPERVEVEVGFAQQS